MDYTGTRIDDDVVCTPPSGASFQVGETTVSCEVLDSAGNGERTDFVVRVLLHYGGEFVGASFPK